MFTVSSRGAWRAVWRTVPGMEKDMPYRSPAFITVTEFARRSGYSRSTVQRMMAAGELAAIRVSARHHPRVLASELDRLLEEASAVRGVGT